MTFTTNTTIAISYPSFRSSPTKTTIQSHIPSQFPHQHSEVCGQNHKNRRPLSSTQNIRGLAYNCGGLDDVFRLQRAQRSLWVVLVIDLQALVDNTTQTRCCSNSWTRGTFCFLSRICGTTVGHKERPQVPERGEAVLILLRDGLNIGTTERFPVKHGSQVMKCRDKSTS